MQQKSLLGVIREAHNQLSELDFSLLHFIDAAVSQVCVHQR